MSVKKPLLIPALKDLLKNPERNLNPLVTQNSLWLVAWTISGRTYLIAGRISEKAFNPIPNNRRTSSIMHYESAWEKWCGYCSKGYISPTRSYVNFILDFLAELFEKGLEYRTIGTHRSAILAFHDLNGNIRVGNHSRVSVLKSTILIRFLPNQSTKVFIYLGYRNCFRFFKEASKKWLAIIKISCADSRL